jgi:hypothetical protein
MLDHLHARIAALIADQLRAVLRTSVVDYVDARALGAYAVDDVEDLPRNLKTWNYYGDHCDSIKA